MSSQYDTSSMKTLAIVTMMFLPGTFVAAVFSMPVFNWAGGNADSIVNHHFGIYWAVTTTLTLLTFVLYGLWLWLHDRHRFKKTRHVALALDGNTAVSECKKLTMKRKNVMSQVN